jgi:hypothetical protein
MSKETDKKITKLLADIKDICLVLTKPEEWRKKHDSKEDNV